MEHDLDPEVLVGEDAGEEVVLVLVIGDRRVGDVAELGAVGQVVHHQDVGAPLLVEGVDHIAADHSRAAGDHDHALKLQIGRTAAGNGAPYGTDGLSRSAAFGRPP